MYSFGLIVLIRVDCESDIFLVKCLKENIRIDVVVLQAENSKAGDNKIN